MHLLIKKFPNLLSETIEDSETNKKSIRLRIKGDKSFKFDGIYGGSKGYKPPSWKKTDPDYMEFTLCKKNIDTNK